MYNGQTVCHKEQKIKGTLKIEPILENGDPLYTLEWLDPIKHKWEYLNIKSLDELSEEPIP